MLLKKSPKKKDRPRIVAETVKSTDTLVLKSYCALMDIQSGVDDTVWRRVVTRMYVFVSSSYINSRTPTLEHTRTPTLEHTHRYDGVLMFYGDVKVCADLSIASLSQRDVTAFIDMRNVERLETIPREKNTIRLHIKGYRTVTMRSIPENSKSAQHKIFLRDGTRWIESISRTWRDLCTWCSSVKRENFYHFSQILRVSPYYAQVGEQF